VKMVHNAIEYVFEQAIGEGFWMLKQSDYDLDIPQVASVWNHGGVIRSWLLELAGQALAKREQFETIADHVGGGSTGTWAIEEARRLHVPTPLMDLAVSDRLLSQARESFARRVVAATRFEFGEHEFEQRAQGGPKAPDR
jgi:6-phosphogluconate dehydrogenase